MFNFLDKEYEEYQTFNSDILDGNKIVFKEKLKTFLWLPTNTVEPPHIYFYFDNCNSYITFKKVIPKLPINKINLTATVDYMDGKPLYEISIKNLQHFQGEGMLIADNWFSGYYKFTILNHITCKMIDNSTEENIFKFFISKSDLLTSRIATMENLNGELTIMGKGDISIKNIEHLGIEEIFTDGYIGEKKNNILKVKFLDRSNTFLNYIQNKLPIVDYVLAITSFAERKRIYWFKSSIVIRNDIIDYYKGNKLYDEDNEAVHLIDRSNLNNFLSVCLNKDLDEIKRLLPFFIAFSNITQNNLESSITGMLFLLEKYIRYKGGNPDHKQTFLKEHKIYTDDLINIKYLKNARNCIAHGHSVPINDLMIVLEHLEITLIRVFLAELGWSFSNSLVSIPSLNQYDTDYKIKVLPSLKKIKCLNNEK